jgi:hypothetical protein
MRIICDDEQDCTTAKHVAETLLRANSSHYFGDYVKDDWFQDFWVTLIIASYRVHPETARKALELEHSYRRGWVRRTFWFLEEHKGEAGGR